MCQSIELIYGNKMYIIGKMKSFEPAVEWSEAPGFSARVTGSQVQISDRT